MFSPRRQYATSITKHTDRRSRSQLKVKVKCLSLAFCVRFIFPEPLKQISLKFGKMFISLRQCAYSITQPRGLKIKVTNEGHRFEPSISCVLMSPVSLKGFNQLFSSQRWCTDPITQTCGPKVKVTTDIKCLSLALRVHSISTSPLKRFSLKFGQLFTSVKQCAELITQPVRLQNRR